jgi:pentatricopeptide repeat protein
MLAMLIHSFVVEDGYMADVVINNALINLYGKLGELENAKCIFRKMADRSVGSWACMIMTYSQWKQDREALELFYDMLIDKQALNELIAVATLNACANFAAVDVGRMIHAWIVIDDVLENKINIANSLMNMYGKCGDFMDVCAMFDRLRLRNIVSWNTIMAACAQGGYGQQALHCLIDVMMETHVKPDEFSCVSLLSSLSHSGMVDEGMYCFTWLVSNYPSLLTAEQCVCMVDLLGRAGQLYEAEKLICNLPILPDASLWSAFLAPCRAASCKAWITHSVDCVLELDR